MLSKRQMRKKYTHIKRVRSTIRNLYKKSAKHNTDNYIRISFENTSALKINADINRLFERFYRADESRNQEISGSGLGLFIAESIVLLHNGEIWIDTDEQQFKVYIKLKINKA
jgi:signal transduction histidine kinase